MLNNSDSMAISCENGISVNVSLVNNKQKEHEISSLSGLPENDSCDKLFDVPMVGEEKHPEGMLYCKSELTQCLRYFYLPYVLNFCFHGCYS